MQHKIFSFYCWLALSLLAHLLFAVLVLTQQSQAPRLRSAAAPMTVFAVSSLSLAPKPALKPTPQDITTPVKDRPQPLVSAAAPVAVNRTKPTRQPVYNKKPGDNSKPSDNKKPSDNSKPRPVSPQTATTATAAQLPAGATTDISALLGSVAVRTARRELSEAEVAALTTRQPEPDARQNHSIRRPAVKPGTGPAADVLETLPDGSQLVKVGKGCVLATPGADLRKDIHSMKVVGCGAGGRSEQDRIDAHFEQVMSKVGQHR